MYIIDKCKDVAIEGVGETIRCYQLFEPMEDHDFVSRCVAGWLKQWERCGSVFHELDDIGWGVPSIHQHTILNHVHGGVTQQHGQGCHPSLV